VARMGEERKVYYKVLLGKALEKRQIGMQGKSKSVTMPLRGSIHN
jgi:hypothetical protein